MSAFSHKAFQGKVYTFHHLDQMTLSVGLTVTGTPISIPVRITFGCHCFTEEFDTEKHGEHHRYTHLKEERAFDVERYECSLQLPKVMNSMLGGTIYRADQSYTYVAQINLPPAVGSEAYSIFFSLEKTRTSQLPAVDMYVKSAYLSPLKHSRNAQSWRFKSLVGDTAEVFPPPPPKNPSTKKNRR